MSTPLVSKGEFLRIDRGIVASLRREGASDLVLVTLSIDTEMMLLGYEVGIFAMPVESAEVPLELYAWYVPEKRGVIPVPPRPGSWLQKVPRSLRKSMRNLRLTVDEDFAGVLELCARIPRDGGWINRTLQDNYLELHARGHGVSVEVWSGSGDLVGGLFGVRFGPYISGESMFHLERDASKAALVRLVELAEAEGVRAIDTQWPTDHLTRMGALEIPWNDYLAFLDGKPLGC